MGILKSLNIANLYRAMFMLKLKINLNLPQLLCIVVSAAQNGEFERSSGFTLTVTTQTTHVTNSQGKSTRSLKFAILSGRSDNTQQLKQV